MENLRSAYQRALVTCKDRHKESDMEQLQQLCERVLSAMEQWHLRTIHELREGHAQEVEILKQVIKKCPFCFFTALKCFKVVYNKTYLLGKRSGLIRRNTGYVGRFGRNA